jgi:hypothetical protein
MVGGMPTRIPERVPFFGQFAIWQTKGHPAPKGEKPAMPGEAKTSRF